MGSFGEIFAAYAAPLFDECNHSEAQVEHAYLLGQICWNLALSPEDMREQTLDEMQHTLEMDDQEFETFKDHVIFPMIQRHYVMFPHMHAPEVLDMPKKSAPTRERDIPMSAQARRRPETLPNAPCPCNSGKKYKRCCGRMD